MVLTSETVPYLLLNRRTGWQEAALEGITLDDEMGTLRLEPQPGQEHPLPVSLVQDGLGNRYIVDTGNRRVQVFALKGPVLRYIWGPLVVTRDAQGHIAVRATTLQEQVVDEESESDEAHANLWKPSGVVIGPNCCVYVIDNAHSLTHVFDRRGQWQCALPDTVAPELAREQPPQRYRSEGSYLSVALDSQRYRCQWHRVQLTATVPSGTSVTVATFTSETDKPLAEIQRLPENHWEAGAGQTHSAVSAGNWDCLVRSQPGRYLWLRLLLQSDGTATPTIERVHVYFPRTSSLRYLPATFSEDPISADLLDRFLSLFDTLRDGIGQHITDIARYFDPLTTPVDLTTQHDFLSWLASWIGLVLNRHWPEAKQRALVRQAAQLYSLRGTVEGLRDYIQLYTDTRPSILEHFKLRSWFFLNEVRLDTQNALWGKEIVKRLQLGENAQIGSFQLVDTGDPVRDPFYQYANQFTVFVPTHHPLNDVDQQALRSIIEFAKPAHTQGYLRIVQPRLRIGVQSLLGVDTLIGRYPAQAVVGESVLGQGSVLPPGRQDVPPTMQIGIQSRIGSSTLLD